MTRTKLILSVVLILSVFSVFSQKYNWKHGIIKGSTFIISGSMAGLHEGLQHPETYNGFKRIFPKSNDYYWNPEISWRRKYDKPYPGSEIFPVFTDGYHLTNAIRTTGLIGSTMFICLGEKRPWWHYAIDIGIGGVFYGIGSNGVYEYLKYRGK